MAFVKASLTWPSTSGSKPLREGFQARCEDAQESGAIGFLDEAVDRGVLPTAITWNIHVREVLDNRALT
uniref:Uncharacterized protein n=1 Tax=Vitis vinifera TaxID=29760 RepID=F6HKX1_VITVI